MRRVEEPGSPALAIPATITSYTSLITDGDEALDAVLVMGLISASAPESEFHPGNCHPRYNTMCIIKPGIMPSVGVGSGNPQGSELR